jgi:colicin import membrane protein
MSTLALQHPPREPGSPAAFWLAVGVHVLLFILLFFGVNWNRQEPSPVMAELWSQIPNVQTPPPAPAPEPPKPLPKVEVKPDPPKPPPPPEPKVEMKPQPKPDIALEAERKKKEAEQKKAEAARLKAEQDRKRREIAEAERKRMMAELNNVPVQPSTAPIKGPTTLGDPRKLSASYSDKIRAAVKSKLNYSPPADVQGNPTAEVLIEQMPTGEVLSVKIVKPSGLPLYDAALERAIQAASPLPKPDKGEPVERQLRLKFWLLEQ